MISKNPWESQDNEDPWNTKKAKKQDADIFQLIKKIKKDFFSFKDGLSDAPNGGGDNPFQGYHLVCSAALVLYFLSGFYQVQHDERGIILRFGKCVRSAVSGLHYALPYPFEEVLLQKVTTVNRIDIGKSQSEDNLILTGDSNLANISFSVLWKIKADAVEEYLFNAKNPEVTVQAVSESVMREVVGQNNFTYVQTDGRAEIQKKVMDSLQSLMNEYKIGVEIIRVDLQKVEPPAPVIPSFRDVENAQAEQQSEKNKAEAYALDKKARTGGAIAEKTNRGEAIKKILVEEANGVVSRFSAAYEQYKISPEIVSKRLYIDTMRDIYKNVNKVIMDDSLKTAPYIAITELMKTSKQAAENEQSSKENT